MEERFGFQALVSRFASLGFILRFIVQTGRSQLCKKEDIIFFQPQFDFARGNLVAVLLKSWRQNCFYTNRGKTGSGGNGRQRFSGVGADRSSFLGNLQKTFFIRQISETFPKSSAEPNILYVFCQQTLWHQTNSQIWKILLWIARLLGILIIRSGWKVGAVVMDFLIIATWTDLVSHICHHTGCWVFDATCFLQSC